MCNAIYGQPAIFVERLKWDTCGTPPIYITEHRDTVEKAVFFSPKCPYFLKSPFLIDDYTNIFIMADSIRNTARVQESTQI